LGFRYLGKHTTEVPFISIDESVVHQISTLNGSQWEGARNQDHGDMFAVCTGDAVDGAKSSDTVCHNHRADAVYSRVSIRRVGGVKIVAVSNPGRLTAVFKLLHESQVVITGNTKQVANTSLLKAAKQKVSN
jgi:hypothetical protein